MKNPWIIDGQTIGSEASGGGVEPIISMTDAERLAVNDTLQPGQLVKVTDQADRIELYLGGGSGNDYWEVVVNSYLLQLHNDSAGSGLTDIKINGEDAPTTTAPFNVVETIGWVKDGDVITCSGAGSYSVLAFGWAVDANGKSSCGANPGSNSWELSFGRQSNYAPISLAEFVVSPIKVPPRGTLRIKG